MSYFDSTYIIKCYLAEPGSSAVLALAEQHAERVCALHGRLEFWSGVKRHVREGQLTALQAADVWRQFTKDESEGLWLFLPLTADLVARACQRLASIADHVPCRAADALHLTCAVEIGLREIYSNDRHLLAAAPHFGLRGVNVIVGP